MWLNQSTTSEQLSFDFNMSNTSQVKKAVNEKRAKIMNKYTEEYNGIFFDFSRKYIALENGKIKKITLKCRENKGKSLWNYEIRIKEYSFWKRKIDYNPNDGEFLVVTWLAVSSIIKTDRSHGGPKFVHQSSWEEIKAFSYFSYIFWYDMAKQINKRIENALIFFWKDV